MRYFQPLASNVDVLPLLHAIQRQPRLWDQERIRTTHPGTPHTQVSDILLRFQDLAAMRDDPQRIIDEHESIPFPAWWALPQARPIVFDLMRRVEGERLGRVLITRLPNGAVIEPHVDGGAHAAYYDRYHVSLQCAPGAMFHCGDEAVWMEPGSVWWFDNSVEHSVVNESGTDRITMIIDIRTGRMC